MDFVEDFFFGEYVDETFSEHASPLPAPRATPTLTERVKARRASSPHPKSAECAAAAALAAAPSQQTSATASPIAARRHSDFGASPLRIASGRRSSSLELIERIQTDVLKLTRSDLAPTDAFRRRGIERTLSKMQQLPFLRDFVVTREHLAEFSAFCDPLVFEKGETLLAKGRSEHYMLLLLSGSVDVLVAPPRKVVIVAPEFVGEACLANPGRKRGASVIAATRVEALKLTRLRLFRLYEHFKTRGAGDSVRRAMDKLVFKAGGQTSIIELRVACDAHTQKQEGQRRARSSGVVAKASAVGPLLPADGTAADDAAAVNAAAAAAEREESLLESLESSVNDNASRRATVLLSTAASAEASRTAASRRATVELRPAVASSEMSASRRATVVLSIARAASSSAVAAPIVEVAAAVAAQRRVSRRALARALAIGVAVGVKIAAADSALALRTTTAVASEQKKSSTAVPFGRRATVVQPKKGRRRVASRSLAFLTDPLLAAERALAGAEGETFSSTGSDDDGDNNNDDDDDDASADPWLAAARMMETTRGVGFDVVKDITTALFEQESSSRGRCVPSYPSAATSAIDTRLAACATRIQSLESNVHLVESQLANDAPSPLQKVRALHRAMADVARLTKMSEERKRMAIERIALLGIEIDTLAEGDRSTDAVEVAVALRKCVEDELDAVKLLQLPSSALQEPMRELSRVLIGDELATQQLDEQVFAIGQRVGAMEQRQISSSGSAAAAVSSSQREEENASRSSGATGDVVDEYQRSLIAWLGAMLRRFDSDDAAFRAEQLKRHGSRRAYELALCRVVAQRVHEARMRFLERFPELAAAQAARAAQQAQAAQRQAHARRTPMRGEPKQTTITPSGGLAPPPPPPPPLPLPVRADDLRTRLRASREDMAKLSAALGQLEIEELATKRSGA